MERLSYTVVAASLAVCLVLAGIIPAGIGTAAATATTSTAEPTFKNNGEPPSPEVTADVIWHDDQTLTIQYETDDSTPQFTVDLLGVENVTSESGFTNVSGEGEWQWDGSTADPSITYNALPFTNNGLVGDGFVAYVPRHSSADVDNFTADLDTSPGVVSNELMLVAGGYKLATREVDPGDPGGETGTIRLVIPCSEQPDPEVDELLDAVEASAEGFKVGHRWEQTTFFVVDDIEGIGIAGFSVGHGDLAVENEANLDTARNVWLHEYAHARQGFNATDSLEWVTEGSAEYFAARQALRQDLVDQEEYNEKFDPDSISNETVLTNKSTWGSLDSYQKGALVLAKLDKKIRNQTNGRKSLEDVFRRLNHHEGNESYADFRAIVKDVAGEDTAQWLDTYATTSKKPTYHLNAPPDQFDISDYIPDDVLAGIGGSVKALLTDSQPRCLG